MTDFLLTDEKIKVSHHQMVENDMYQQRGEDMMYGIPVDPENPNKGLKWTELLDITEDQYERLEEYFIAKQNKN